MNLFINNREREFLALEVRIFRGLIEYSGSYTDTEISLVDRLLPRLGIRGTIVVISIREARFLRALTTKAVRDTEHLLKEDPESQEKKAYFLARLLTMRRINGKLNKQVEGYDARKK